MKSIIAGSACVIISELGPDEIERFRRFRPDALRMTDENDPENEFSIDLEEGPGRLEKTGAVFCQTKSPDGKATITILLDPSEEDKLGIVRNQLGPAMILLQALEEKLIESTEQVKELEKKANDMFTLLK